MSEITGIAILKDNTRLYLKEAAAFAAFALADKVSRASSIGESGEESEETDTTAIDSEAKESVPAFASSSDITVTMQISDATVTNKYRAWQAAGTILVAGLICDNGALAAPNVIYDQQAFKCWVKSVKTGERSLNGVFNVTMVLKVSGKIYSDATDVDNPDWSKLILGKMPLKGGALPV